MSMLNTYWQNVKIDQSGNTLTLPIATSNYTLVRLAIGATWDAATITIQESADGTGLVFQTLKDTDGTVFTIQATAYGLFAILPQRVIGATGFLKIVSSAAQNTGAPRIVSLLWREVV